jgi:hypothetical protein
MVLTLRVGVVVSMMVVRLLEVVLLVSRYRVQRTTSRMSTGSMTQRETMLPLIRMIPMPG